MKYASIEVSGQLGYELKDSKKPLTQEEFIKLMNGISEMKAIVVGENMIKQSDNKENNIFEEINKNKCKGDKKEP